jgi:hypothetical protein
MVNDAFKVRRADIGYYPTIYWMIKVAGVSGSHGSQNV